MSFYSYQALDQHGKLQKGTYDAGSESEVRQHLRSLDWYPTEIKISRFSKASTTAKRFDWKKWIQRDPSFHKEVTIFTRQLETLLVATIPYDKALEMIISQTIDGNFKGILSDIRSRVVEGGSLAEAMHRHRAFPAMYVSMVRSGESGGSLELIMKRLADYYENQDRLYGSLKSAMIYPAFMMLFGVGVVSFMMLYIVPKILKVFETQDAILPLPTRILIGTSYLFSHYWWAMMIITVGSIIGVRHYFKTISGIRFKHQLQLRTPGIKNLVIKVMVLRFCQTLATLLKSGVDLKAALEISKHVVVNSIFIERLNQLIVDVNNKGVPLSAAMKRIEYFPEYVHHVVAIGEQSAKVDELLDKISIRMQMEVSDTVTALTSLLQPILILAMGAVVGFIALAILLPMLNMSQLLK